MARPRRRRGSSTTKLLVAGGIAAALVGLGAWKLASGSPGTPPPPPTPKLTTISNSALAPNPVTAGLQVLLTALAVDQNGKPFPGATGGVRSDGTVIPGATWTSAADGTLSVPLTFPTAATYSVVAYSGSVSGAAVSLVVSSGGPPPPVLTTLSAPAASVATLQAGGSDTFTIQAFDQNGAPMAGVVGNLDESGVTAPGSTFTTDANGIGSVTLVFPVQGSFPITAVSGTVTSSPTTITVTPGTVHVLTSIAQSQGGTGTVNVGDTELYTEVAKDETGSVMPNISIQLYETVGAATTAIPGATGTTDASGSVIIAVVWPVAGSYPVTAQSGTVISNAVTTVVNASVNFNVISNVIGTSPAGQTTVPAGQYIQYQALGFVTAGDNPLGIPVRWLINGVDMAVPGSVTGPGGGAPGQWSAYWGQGFPVAGTYTIQAVVGGFPSNTLTLTVT